MRSYLSLRQTQEVSMKFTQKLVKGDGGEEICKWPVQKNKYKFGRQITHCPPILSKIYIKKKKTENPWEGIET